MSQLSEKDNQFYNVDKRLRTFVCMKTIYFQLDQYSRCELKVHYNSVLREILSSCM